MYEDLTNVVHKNKSSKFIKQNLLFIGSTSGSKNATTVVRITEFIENVLNTNKGVWSMSADFGCSVKFG